jgi:general secretion pathway protein C
MNRIIELLASQGQQIERLRMIIILLFIAMAAKPAAEITWKFFSFGENQKSLTEQSQSTLMPQEKFQLFGKTTVGGLAISAADFHLFGEAGRVTVAPVAGSMDVPKTSLNLILKGVIAAASMNRALAVINQKGGKEEDSIYGVGEKVLGMAEIREIYADRVILLRGGKLETLMLEDVEDIVAVQFASASSTVSSSGDGLHWNISSAYWNTQINDIPSLAKQVGVDIYRENNVQKGFKLVSSRGNKLISDLGLQAGDVLYEVNGIKLTNAHNGLMAYQQIKGASQVTLKVGRSGQVMTRIYTIQ